MYVVIFHVDMDWCLVMSSVKLRFPPLGQHVKAPLRPRAASLPCSCTHSPCAVSPSAAACPRGDAPKRPTAFKRTVGDFTPISQYSYQVIILKDPPMTSSWHFVGTTQPKYLPIALKTRVALHLQETVIFRSFFFNRLFRAPFFLQRNNA